MNVERPLPVAGQPPRIVELWAWTATDPLTDTEGIISARTHDGQHLPLVASVERLARLMEPLAREAVAKTEHPRPTAQLRHFIEAD